MTRRGAPGPGSIFAAAGAALILGWVAVHGGEATGLPHSVAVPMTLAVFLAVAGVLLERACEVSVDAADAAVSGTRSAEATRRS